MKRPCPPVDLVGVGLNATDTVILLPQYPAKGSKVEYSVETVMLGGQVASTVVACQTWGLRTRYIGKFGNDNAARMHHDEFARLGVEAQMIEVVGAASPRSTILVDWDGERTVLCRRDEQLTLRPEELDREWILSARALHVDGHDTAAAILASGWARDASIPVVADLDEIYPGVEELVHNIDYLVVSRDFPGRFMADNDPERALQRIQQRYNCVLTAATLGSDGVVVWDGKQFHRRSAYCVDIVDTTGAGDIFHAGFIFGMLRGWPLERQLDFACAAAALNCTAAGARGSIQPVAMIESLMSTGARYHGLSHFPADLG